MDSSAFPILEDSKRFKPFLDGLKEIYHHRIRPVEELYNFDGFYSKPITNSELEAKPIVLLLGQYSTGKTSFIEYLLGSPYPGAHIGPEPTTDRFVAVMHDLEDNVIPGNAAAIQVDKPFRTLTQFGSSFLSKFQLSLTPNPLVDSISLIDTPGILSGEKQRLGRAYDFVKVCQWFAEKSDIILLFFDAHKLDISDEFKAVISSLKTHDNKIRVILNKADSVTHQQLMRIHGALMWSLGKIIQTPEVVRVYVGSFWKGVSAVEDNVALIKVESDVLLQDLYSLPSRCYIRKIDDLLKRCRLLRVHAYLIAALRREMPVMWGKGSKRTELLNRLPELFTALQKSRKIPPGDFPDIHQFKTVLEGYDFTRFAKLNQKLLDKLEFAIEVDLPRLMHELPQL